MVQTTYLRNICELTDYCPELGARMWSEVVDRMLRIDVEITRAGEEDEDEDDDEEERLLALMSTSDITGDPFELRLDQDIPLDPIVKEETDGLEDSDQDIDDLSSVEGSVSDAEEETDEMKEAIARARKKLATLLNRRKLDGMMHYFIRHLGESMGARAASPPAAQMAAATLASVSGSGESTPTSEYPSTPTSAQPGTASFALAAQLPRVRRTPAEGLAAFQTLLNLFSRQILQTSSTQHIPFLLFVASSYSPAHTDLFLGLLVSLSLYGTSSAHSTHLTTGTIASQNQRIAATVYIGGIVCRARFVTDDQARHVLKYLLAYIDGKMLQAKQGRPDELPLFYAVCQAVMMIFCFRWRALAKEEEGEEGVVGEMELLGDGEGLGGEGGRWMAELEVLQRVITSDLNPLLVRLLPLPVGFVYITSRWVSAELARQCTQQTDQLGLQHHRRPDIRQSGTPSKLCLLLLHHGVQCLRRTDRFLPLSLCPAARRLHSRYRTAAQHLLPLLHLGLPLQCQGGIDARYDPRQPCLFAERQWHGTGPCDAESVLAQRGAQGECGVGLRLVLPVRPVRLAADGTGD